MADAPRAAFVPAVFDKDPVAVLRWLEHQPVRDVWLKEMEAASGLTHHTSLSETTHG